MTNIPTTTDSNSNGQSPSTGHQSPPTNARPASNPAHAHHSTTLAPQAHYFASSLAKPPYQFPEFRAQSKSQQRHQPRTAPMPLQSPKNEDVANARPKNAYVFAPAEGGPCAVRPHRIQHARLAEF